MAKPARAASSKVAAKKSAPRKASGFSAPKSDGKNTAYWRIRERIEGMYALHLLLLIVMSSLGAAMFVIAVNQKIRIQNLEFQLDFLSQRYEILKQSEQMKREASDRAADGLPALPAAPSMKK